MPPTDIQTRCFTLRDLLVQFAQELDELLALDLDADTEGPLYDAGSAMLVASHNLRAALVAQGVQVQ